MRITVGLALLGLGLLGACGDATGPEDELVANRGKWLSHYIADYTYEYERWCFCRPSPGPIRLTVHDDSVIAAVVIATNDTLTDAEIAQAGFKTVDELFPVILDATASGADDLDVEYDPVLGYPRLIAIDYDEQTVDEEITYLASNLRLPRRLQ